jgi:hypothetical protein
MLVVHYSLCISSVSCGSRPYTLYTKYRKVFYGLIDVNLVLEIDQAMEQALGLCTVQIRL